MVANNLADAIDGEMELKAKMPSHSVFCFVCITLNLSKKRMDLLVFSSIFSNSYAFSHITALWRLELTQKSRDWG